MTSTSGLRRSGFTVVELLVAIAVLAIIAVGLSVIFGTVGDAVTDGRRVSELNRASARIEQQIRDDLSGLTRDGFLVIANRYASDDGGLVFTGDLSAPGAAPPPNDGRPPGVGLSIADPAPRARRADEIMFFARGDFETKRLPLAPGLQASGSEAAIYYGIGQKRPIDIFANPVNQPSNFYFNPSPTDSNLRSDRVSRYAALLGKPEPVGELPNPNRYAGEWSLLRQVTLLAEPQIVTVLPNRVFGLRRDNLQQRTLMFDSARQVSLQPAARSIFNSLAWTDPSLFGSPGSVPPDGLSRWWIGDLADYGPGGLPTPAERSLPAWRSSGVVDIAQGSILTIRRELESLAVFGPPSRYYAPSTVNPFNPRPARFQTSADGFASVWNNQATPPSPRDGSTLDLTDATTRFNLRAWALDMLPSLWDGENAGGPPRYLAGVRYEDLPTRLVYDEDRFDENDAGRLGQAILEANQEMLVSQVFVPRCSEFIVEWSYGFVDNVPQTDPGFKQLRWHGLPRADRDENGDGRLDLSDHATTTRPIATRYVPRVSVPPNTDPDPLREQVALTGPTGSPSEPEVVVFGLTTPSTGTNPTTYAVAVPWPKFIRVTVSLADPDDDTLERTYQFVFALPGEQG
jgi:prepilin-type N-terminal cleavage/methylation domain-containing protein